MHMFLFRLLHLPETNYFLFSIPLPFPHHIPPLQQGLERRGLLTIAFTPLLLITHLYRLRLHILFPPLFHCRSIILQSLSR